MFTSGVYDDFVIEDTDPENPGGDSGIPSTCVSDNHLADANGAYCDSYIGNQGVCGLLDTDEFFAGTACCACGGGFDSNTPPPVSEEAICQDDLSVTDFFGDTCEWYNEDDNDGWCGYYDDSDFDAKVACCICGGSNFASVHVIAYPEQVGCEDDMTVTDFFGDTCEWYVDQVHTCGQYDDSDFEAKEACCVCDGVDSFW